LKRFFKKFWKLIRQTGQSFSEDDSWTLASALSYSTLFSLVPILVIVISGAGLVFGRDAVQGQIFGEVKSFLGVDGAIQLENMLKIAYQPGKNEIATIIAIILLVIGATSVFNQLQSSLNKIWEVKPKPKTGYLKYLSDRVLSFGLIIVIGFLLLVSFVLSAALTGFSHFLVVHFSLSSVVGFHILDIIISVGVITVLFALIYKFLPDAKIDWRDVWMGAFVTAILFILSKLLIGIYVSQSRIGSTYGAAGFIILILVWVNYSAQILFLGAEFTKVYAQTYGKQIEPADFAVRTKNIEVEQAVIESTEHFEKKVDAVEQKSDDLTPGK
jgi:membrane protein